MSTDFGDKFDKADDDQKKFFYVGDGVGTFKQWLTAKSSDHSATNDSSADG